MVKPDKVAIVTGKSYGIGRACSKILAEAKINIAILSRKRKEGLDTLEELKRFKIKALYIETDVSDREQVRESVARVYNKFKRIDILINNAGIVSPLKYFLSKVTTIGTGS